MLKGRDLRYNKSCPEERYQPRFDVMKAFMISDRTHFYPSIWATLLTMLLLALPAPAEAQQKFYIRDGGTTPGTCSNCAACNICSDWSSACDTLPATLCRGATYYFADGAYPAYTFDDPGTAPITIKKAAKAPLDHGTETGWNPAYGDGQAIFSAPLSFTSSYWTFDGATRDESDWFNSSAYGFAISDNGNVQIEQRGIGGIHDIQIRHTYLKGINSSPGTGGDIGRRHIFLDDQGSNGSYSNWTISRSFFQYGNVGIQVRDCSGFIVEYNAWADNWSSQPNNHGENVSAYYGGNDGHIYRFNQSRNMIGTAAWAVNSANNWKVYGNVYADCTYGDGFIGYIGGSSTGFEIYNETIIRPKVYTRQVSLGGGSVIKNSIFMMGALGTPTFDGCTVTNGAFSGSGTGANAQTNIGTGLFVNYAGGNYRLAAGTNPGESLPAPFNTDLTGITRGLADGVWDRGAFEFNGGSGPVLSPPRNLRLNP